MALLILPIQSSNSSSNSAYSNYSRNQIYLSFIFQKTLLKFWAKFAQRRVFSVKIIKSEHHHLIQHIRISLGNKFHRKQTTLSLWIKFAQEGYFPSKTGKTNVAIEFRILELLCVHRDFLTKFAQKVYFLSKTVKTNVTIQFTTFELVLVTNFILNK